MTTHPEDTHQKALRINLDAARYGTFAEIGAGQEVAGWFFHVGAASGTVAKSMSAYDMTVSDSIYGKSGRYVSKERLIAMLDHEYELLVERLQKTRGPSTRFFTFADTVSTRNYAGTNECHGWMGLRFQVEPNSPHSEILIHVNLYDDEAVRQQEALGILGVNLLYAAFYFHADTETLLRTLRDSLPAGRIEVDYIEARGPVFADWNLVKLNVLLLRHGLTQAVLFDSTGTPTPPTDFFHKRPILIERGSFRALHHLFPDLVPTCHSKLGMLAGEEARECAYVLEITLNNILRTKQTTDDELMDVVQALASQKQNVLVSSYSEFFYLTRFLRRFSHSPIGFIVSAALLPLLFEDDRYALLRGGVLEASARLFQHQVHLMVYPVESQLFREYLELVKFDLEKIEFPPAGKVTARDVKIKNATYHLHQYLLEAGIVVDVDVRH